VCASCRLSENCIGDAGLAVLSDAVLRNFTLTELLLSQHELLSPEAMAQLAFNAANAGVGRT
jgi:hypothetical protein